MKRANIFFLLFLVMTVAGCGIKNKKTRLQIVDNNRHYYPILRGQKLDVVVPIKNVGKIPFILSDIFTSCGCVVVSDKSSIKAIPPGKEGNLILEYNSNLNVGYVQHFVTIYGNLDSVKQMTISFDVNVVPEVEYTKDYEQIYKESEDKDGLKEMTDGSESNKGYYLDKRH
jgi:hypothetical protein